MNEELSMELVKAISDNLPRKINIASYLSEILSISKEAAYRRIRREVLFNFDEAAKIVSDLNLSLDKVLGNNLPNSAIINMSLIKSSDNISNYDDTLIKYLSICHKLKEDPYATLHEATNKLPLHLYAPHTYITKFWIGRWLHQSDNLKGTGSLDDIEIPKKTIDLHKKLSRELRSVATSLFVWDKNIFLNFVKGVSYFAKLNLMSKSDLNNIRKELFNMLDELEVVLKTSTYKEGGKVYIYICNIPIETIYSYFESKDVHISMLRIYAINMMDSEHPDVFKLQKEWVQSLRRYSTLITDSSEMERIKYLDQQREYVSLLKL